MNRSTLALLITTSLFLMTGCAANGPLLKSSKNFRRAYVSQHSELSEQIKQAILEGKVIEGMTKEDVRATWGNPSRINDFSADSNAWWYDPYGEGWWYKPFPISFEPTRFVKFKKGIVDYTSKDYK